MPLHQISVTPGDRAKHFQDKGMRHETKETYHVTSPTPPVAAERCSSRASTLSYSRDFCRICHCEGDSEVPLISPCFCAGSLRYVHQACLQQWIKSSDIKCCELCKFAFIMQTKTKPFSLWERLDMAASERRKLLCSVTFHVVALTCVVWSLYVLIERTTEEVHSGVLGWPFWTKLIVVAIGVTGGIVFMYVQCKVYAQLCRRWRAYNRVIFVQNVPEKVPPVDLEAGRAAAVPPMDLEAGRAAAVAPRNSGEGGGEGAGEWAMPADAAPRRVSSEDPAAPRRVSRELAAAPRRVSREDPAAPRRVSRELAAAPRRVSREDAGRVHVTIEQSSSGAVVLPPIAMFATSGPHSPPSAPLSPLGAPLSPMGVPLSPPSAPLLPSDAPLSPPGAPQLPWSPPGDGPSADADKLDAVR